MDEINMFETQTRWSSIIRVPYNFMNIESCAQNKYAMFRKTNGIKSMVSLKTHTAKVRRSINPSKKKKEGCLEQQG